MSKLHDVIYDCSLMYCSRIVYMICSCISRDPLWVAGVGLVGLWMGVDAWVGGLWCMGGFIWGLCEVC